MQNTIRILLVGTVCLALMTGCTHSPGTTTSPARQKATQVSEAYGIDGFSDIETIRFTFNVQIGDRNIVRKWSWEPGKDAVIFEGNLPTGHYGKYAYLRADLDPALTGISEKIDRWCINDRYWLLFPLQLAWDKDLTLSLEQDRPLPIPPGNADRLTVTYPPGVGYTPGDAYELYLDERNRIVQWIYRRGGAKEPTRVTTWEKHVNAGPLVLSLEHQSRDGSFRLWFDEVRIRVKGNEKWMTPEPLK
jgi:hypothetical protein